MKLRRYSGAVYDEDELSNMKSAMLEGWWSGGEYTNKFEEKFSRFLEIKHTMTCNSGSSANLLAVSALELKKKSEVITPATTFPTTLNPIIQCGLKPVFVDVELGTYNIDANLIEKAISKKVKLIVMPHTLGNPCEMDMIIEICEKNDIILIEDSCDAIGSTYDGKYVSTFGDIGTFSFYPAHHMTTGEGGAVVTGNEELAEKVKGYRDWGRLCNCEPCLEVQKKDENYLCSKRLNFKIDGVLYDRKYAYGYIGYNLKMTEIQAAMGLAQLKKLKKFIRVRKENFETIYKILKDCKNFILPETYEKADPSWFAFPLTIKNGAPFSRYEVIRYLEKNGIQSRLLFGGNITRQPAYRDVDYRTVGKLSNSDKIFKDTFFVGVYPGLNEEDMQFIGETLLNIDNGGTKL